MRLATPKKLLTFGAVLLASTLIIPSVAFGIGGGVGGRPAYPDPNNPRTSSIFIYTLEKGAGQDDAVIVANNTQEVQTVELYATDSAVSNTGAFTCKQKVEATTDVGAWVTLSKTEVTLQPATKEIVPFSITVPEGADVGEHNGCLVFQPKGDEGVVKGNVRIRTRSAIRMSVTIPGDLRREISISSFETTQKDGKQLFTLTVKNNGNVSTDIDGTVTLSTLFGSEVFKNGGGYPVIAGKSLDLNFTNDKPPFWGGIYVASATVAFDKRAGTFGTSDTANLTSIDGEKQYLFIAPSPSATALYALVALVAGTSLGYVLYRRHDKKHTLRKWQSHTVGKDETLQSLAESYGIGWKKLASMNSIKPPYTLEKGTKIKVPKRTSKK